MPKILPGGLVGFSCLIVFVLETQRDDILLQKGVVPVLDEMIGNIHHYPTLNPEGDVMPGQSGQASVMEVLPMPVHLAEVLDSHIVVLDPRIHLVIIAADRMCGGIVSAVA